MNNDPADLDLQMPSRDTSSSPQPPRKRPTALLLTALALLLALAAGFLYLRRPAPPSPVADNVNEPAQTPAPAVAEPGEQIVLPPLDETDALVRRLVGALSTHPTVAAWLTTDGLILNFVVVTTRIASGQTPVAELKAIGPMVRFRPRTSGNDAYLDRAGYRRYDRYAAAVSALDARGAARLYATLKPRIADAYRRTGGVGNDFDAVLERAFVELLGTPVAAGDVALRPKGIVYAFADPRLQNLSAAQKQLLRMGPQNVEAVQGKLREIASHLAIPESRLPRPSLAPPFVE